MAKSRIEAAEAKSARRRERNLREHGPSVVRVSPKRAPSATTEPTPKRTHTTKGAKRHRANIARKVARPAGMKGLRPAKRWMQEFTESLPPRKHRNRRKRSR